MSRGRARTETGKYFKATDTPGSSTHRALSADGRTVYAVIDKIEGGKFDVTTGKGTRVYGPDEPPNQFTAVETRHDSGESDE